MQVTEAKINPKMITLARESRGLTQKELADTLNVSPAKLCKVEQDSQSLNVEIEKLSEVLRYPASFFYQEGEALPSNLNFRKRMAVSQKLIMPIEAQINIYRLNIETILKAVKQPDHKNTVIDLTGYDHPGAVAKKLRKLWKVPKGRVENIIELLEEKGIIVVSFDFGTERVDSRTIVSKTKNPVIVLNKALLGDRQRLSLAFELGNLIMHVFTMPAFSRDLCHESNLFAAEFLMPEEDIRKDFEGEITIAKLAELKRKWKVSMQALLYRASDLGFLTDNQKRYLLQQFNQMHIRRREPPELDVPQEKPRLLRDLITKYRKAQRMTLDGMAKLVHLEEKDFLQKYVN